MRSSGSISRKALAYALLMSGFADHAFAQDAAQATSAGGASDAQAAAVPAATGLGEITVTARKRAESSLKIPVAITAFSSKQLDALNISNVESLVQFTPGLQLNDIAAGQNRADRSRQSLIIRGMAPSSGSDTTSVFINGVPVDGAVFSGIFDYDRIEVLKGPQSAYFGRQTFAGAANIVTKAPTDTFQGYVEGSVGTRNNDEIKGAVGGPIIPGILSFRATGRYFTKDGSWTNNAEPDQKLGNQSTRSGTLELKFTPTDALTIRVFGMASQDDDGPAATSLLGPDQANCQLPNVKYFCGTLPSIGANQPSARTTVTPGVADMLANYTPLMSNSQQINHFGFKRDTRMISGTIDYALPDGITLTSLTGYNTDNWSTLYQQTADASMIPNTYTSGPDALAYTDWPLTIQHKGYNFSQEFRVASRQDGRFRWIFGGSFLHSKAHEAYAQLYYLAEGASGAYSPTTENKTASAFFGLAFDLTKQLTLNVDGRYQSDTLISRDGATDAVGYDANYKSFTPRVSLQYQIAPQVMTYATYSKGVNPGLGLDPLLAVPASYVAALQAQGVTSGVKPEYLDNYEVGLKGKFFGGRLVISADVYYDVWKDKIVESTLLIPRAGDTPLFVNAYTNMGKVDLKGLEAEMTAMPVNGLTFNVSGAINDSSIKSGACDACYRETGSTYAVGNQLAWTSKYSAQGWAEYTAKFAPVADTAWFARGEISYKSGFYESDGDYAKTSPAIITNFRLGVRRNHLNLEAFVTNAFNNKAYTSARPGWDLTSAAQTFNTYDSVYVGLPDLRTFGLRFRYDY